MASQRKTRTFSTSFTSLRVPTSIKYSRSSTAFPEIRGFLENDATLRHVKSAQRAYFIRLTSGKYDLEYAENRLRIGCVHKFVGLTPRWYMGAYAIYLEIVLPRVLGAFEYDRAKQHRAVIALTKLISLDQELALLSYHHRDTQPSEPH